MCDVLKEKYNTLKSALSSEGASLGVDFNMGGVNVSDSSCCSPRTDFGFTIKLSNLDWTYLPSTNLFYTHLDCLADDYDIKVSPSHFKDENLLDFVETVREIYSNI